MQEQEKAAWTQVSRRGYLSRIGEGDRIGKLHDRLGYTCSLVDVEDLKIHQRAQLRGCEYQQ
jgi:hypothetical protein